MENKEKKVLKQYTASSKGYVRSNVNLPLFEDQKVSVKFEEMQWTDSAAPTLVLKINGLPVSPASFISTKTMLVNGKTQVLRPSDFGEDSFGVILAKEIAAAPQVERDDMMVVETEEMKKVYDKAFKTAGAPTTQSGGVKHPIVGKLICKVLTDGDKDRRLWSFDFNA